MVPMSVLKRPRDEKVAPPDIGGQVGLHRAHYTVCQPVSNLCVCAIVHIKAFPFAECVCSEVFTSEIQDMRRYRCVQASLGNSLTIFFSSQLSLF